MGSTPRMELVNIEGAASDGFRLGIKLKTTPDGLKLFATFRKHPPEPPIIEDYIRKAGVKAPVNLGQFRDLTRVLEIANQKSPVLLADLTPGALTQFDWRFTEHQEVVASFWARRQTEEGALLPGLWVEKDTPVATRQDTERVAADLGYTDIFGKSRDGKSRLVSFKSGKGLKEDQDGCIVATESGYLVIAGETVSVREKLLLESQAEVTSEPITFLGSIEVKAKVTHAPSLMAAHDLTIQGNWKGGNLKSDGVIRIAGELSGQEPIEAESKGGIVANFVNNCRLRCEGDITIQNGAFFSLVRALGFLSIPRGAVVGGRFYGAKGIQVLEAGDAGGEATVLEAGYSERIADSVGATMAEYHRVEEKLLEIQSVVRPLLQNPEARKALDREAQATFTQLLGAIKTLRNEYVRLGRQLEETYHGEYDEVSIRVDGKLHPGCTLVINNAEHVVREIQTGVTFRYDPKTRAIVAG